MANLFSTVKADRVGQSSVKINGAKSIGKKQKFRPISQKCFPSRMFKFDHLYFKIVRIALEILFGQANIDLRNSVCMILWVSS